MIDPLLQIPHSLPFPIVNQTNFVAESTNHDDHDEYSIRAFHIASLIFDNYDRCLDDTNGGCNVIPTTTFSF